MQLDIGFSDMQIKNGNSPVINSFMNILTSN